MSSARHLRVVDGNGELVDNASPEETIHALQAALTRAQRTIDALRADKTRERKQYAKRMIIEDAFDDHITKLVNTGIAEFQFVVYGKRRQHGPDDSRNVDIAWTCEKARRFEEAARLGAIVMKAREAS